MVETRGITETQEVVFNDRLRTGAKHFFQPLAERLHTWGVKANHASFVGAGLGYIAAGAIATGHIDVGAPLMLTCTLDTLDGSLAALEGKKESGDESGGFLDSMLDRTVDAALFSGAAYEAFQSHHNLGGAALLLFMSSSVLTSYSRAVGEAKGVPAKDEAGRRIASYGFMERAQRLVYLGAGLLTVKHTQVDPAIVFGIGAALQTHTAVTRSRRIFGFLSDRAKDKK